AAGAQDGGRAAEAVAATGDMDELLAIRTHLSCGLAGTRDGPVLGLDIRALRCAPYVAAFICGGVQVFKWDSRNPGASLPQPNAWRIAVCKIDAGRFEPGALYSSFGSFASHVSPAAFGLTRRISRNLKR
ncbi:MAG: hypothetical protein ACLPIC_03670, partial [Rhodoblastus sp.]|uniref:hypothetical protein n=1 Tax=Rhodoblastus sp. TaxID=1962975 RepID=UPI003F9A9AD8